MRMLGKILLAVVALLVLAVLVVLVPPHLQIRGVAPELPSVESLRGLGAVADGPVRIRTVTTSEQPVMARQLGHMVFLIEWADGRTFMIDAGMDRAEAAEFAELMKLLGDPGEPVIHGSVAELLGEGIARITGVGFTHLHIDHTQGLVPFCEARGAGAVLAQTDDQKNLHNVHTEEGAAIAADSCLAPAIQSGGPLIAIDGFPGFGIAALGGHTPGSTLFAAAVDGHLWIFSGDITNAKADILEDRGKGFVYSYLTVPENTARTAELRAWLRALDAEPDVTVVVSHDLNDIRTLPLAAY